MFPRRPYAEAAFRGAPAPSSSRLPANEIARLIELAGELDGLRKPEERFPVLLRSARKQLERPAVERLGAVAIEVERSVAGEEEKASGSPLEDGVGWFPRCLGEGDGLRCVVCEQVGVISDPFACATLDPVCGRDVLRCPCPRGIWP